MWLMTPRGFYSVVQKRGDDLLTVRARVRADLERLSDVLPGVKPYRGQSTDYPWRIRVARAEWVAAVAVMCDEIRYPNFKDEVQRRQGKRRADVYLRVWSALHSLTERRSRPAGQRTLPRAERWWW